MGNRWIICCPLKPTSADLLLIPAKQIHLIKTKLLHLERQREIPRALEQQIVRRLLAVTQTFDTESVDRFNFR